MPKCWCNRATGGFGYKDRTMSVKFCSRKHQVKFMENLKAGKAINPMQQNEIDAIYVGIKRAGQYAKEIGKTDLSKFTAQEIYHLFATAYATTCEELTLDKDDIPF